ncbi:MAG: proteasome assembly chaperone family protein [Promethearchaeota archaeon]|nr:MAG: proteasome assembly chaperone family protein [Candidatus Lokiarchaeota archaeon]
MVYLNYFIKLNQVDYMNKNSDMEINIILEEERDFTDYTLITGFHGIGACGFITVRHIIDSLKCKRIGYIETEMLPALVSLEDNKLVMPFEFYEYEKNLMFIPRFQPYRAEQRIIARDLSNFVVQNKFKNAFMIGGLDSKFKKDDDTLCRVVPTRGALELVKNNDKIAILEKGLYVTGPLALFLTYFEIQAFPALAILPYAERERPDPRASAEAIKTLNLFCEMTIDTEQLIKDAKRIETELEEVFLQDRTEPTDSSDSRRMYI